MAVDDEDLARLSRAVALAAKGRFAVEPNPPVGCVLVRDGRVVGESWHEAYGGPHAEARALALAGDLARGATAYVSLEPCVASPGKKTGACADRLAAAGVRRVVHAATDPNPAVSGAGAARLAALGLEVVGPVDVPGADDLLGAFRRSLASSRPWTVLKWAMSWDGRIAPAAGRGGTLSGPEARRYVHDLRGRVEAVAVGVRTVRTDDPRLTCRLEGGPPDGRAQPLRVVLDSRLATPPSARLLAEAGGPVLVVAAEDRPAERRRLEERGAEVWVVPGASGRVDLAVALGRLRAERGVRRLLVEGGARIHGALLRAGLADQVVAILAPRLLGAEGAPPATEGTGFDDLATAPVLSPAAWRPLGADLLLRGHVARGDAVSARSDARS